MTKARKVLTDTLIKAAKAGDARYELPDALLPCFYLIVQPKPSGVKSFAIRYRRPSDGKPAKMTIGRYPAMSLEDAREAARKALGKVQNREDPVKRASDPEELRTFGDL